MEFACGFVYVPPSLSQREVQRSPANPPKRSALLPPVKPLRPRNPPPPPPPSQPLDPKVKPQQSPDLSQNISERQGKSQDVGISKPVSLFFKRPEFPRKPEAAASSPPTGAGSPGTAPPRKTALVPLNVRSTSNTAASSDSNNQRFYYDEAEYEPDSSMCPIDGLYCYTLPECSGGEVKPPPDRRAVSGSPPALPPRPPFMHPTPEYLMVLPSPVSTPGTPQTSTAKDKSPLPGNPNIVLISLGKLLSEEKEPPTDGEPTLCSQCGSALDIQHNDQCPLNDQKDELFLLNPHEQPPSAADSLLLFCIDTSGSMNITSKVSEPEQNIYRTRLQFVQEAVLRCVQELSDQQPELRVGLITFNYQVRMLGCNNFQSQLFSGAELNDSSFLTEAAAGFPIPPPLLQTKDCLQRQILGLSANGETALGPAALLAVTMASRLAGSKVIVCTDGKANAKLGNLEEEDNDAHTLLSSTIFYQDLGDYAAKKGVTVSVMSIEGTDCRLEELGRLADRTGGKVVIASPNQLHSEFKEMIGNRTIATHCTVTFLLPKSLRLKGEREAGNKGTREVGNVNIDTEVTIQFGADEHTEVAAPASGSRVLVQLQIRYRRNGQDLLRVFTAERNVTDDSSAALSSLSLAIVQLNSLQASAALAVRGRFLEARMEGALQQQLIERAMEHNQSTEDKRTYQEWVKTMEPINNNIFTLTRRSSVISDSESLTDAGAALLITMKHSNRTSISLKLKDKNRL